MRSLPPKVMALISRLESLYAACRKYDLRSAKALSTYPCDEIFDSLPDNSKFSLILPVVNFTVCLRVLNDPKEFEVSPPASSAIASVKIFRLAPKAPDPLVEVPTPRCSCRFSVEEAKSPKFTQKVPWLSASL